MSSLRRVQPALVLTLLSILLLLAVVIAVASGAVTISLADASAAIFGHVRGDKTDQISMILMQIRLPRTLLAALVGAILAISGAAMQGLFRNLICIRIIET